MKIAILYQASGNVISTVIFLNLRPDRLRGKSDRDPDVRVHEIGKAGSEKLWKGAAKSGWLCEANFLIFSLKNNPFLNSEAC